MNMPGVYKENYILCEISPQQAYALEGFCKALRSFYEDAEAIPPQIAESALKALVEISQCQESDQSHQQWCAMRSPATRLAGITVLVKNESGDELMLQLDADGHPHIGTWTLFDEQGMPRHMILFDMIQGVDGWKLRLDNASETTEILIGETSGDLNWTHQPDYHVEMESDDINKDSLSEISDEITEESVENAVPAVTDTDGIENELSQYSVEPDLQKINRSQESHMRENNNLPPKIPPQRIPRKPEPNFAAQQYSPGPPPPPPAGQKNTNTLAIISLIASIIGILSLILALCSWCLGLFPLMFSIAGAVMGFLAKKKIDESGGAQSGRKMAMIGMIMGLVGAGLSVVLIVLSIIFSGLMMLPAFLSDFY